MKQIIASLVILLYSHQALAWGDREQGVLLGAAGVILWNKLSQAAENNQRPQQPLYTHSSTMFIVVVLRPKPTAQCPCTYLSARCPYPQAFKSLASSQDITLVSMIDMACRWRFESADGMVVDGGGVGYIR